LIQEKYNRIFLPFIFIIDLLIILIFYYFCISNNQLIDFLFILFSWTTPSLYFKSFQIQRTYSIINALRPMLLTMVVFFFIYFLFITINIFPEVQIKMHILFILSIFTILLSSSVFRYIFFYRYRLKGKNTRYAILLVDNIILDEFEKLKRDALHFGYTFIDYYKIKKNYYEQLQKLFQSKRIDLVFIKNTNKSIIDNISGFCDENGVRLKLLLGFSTSTGQRAGLDHIGGFPIMDLRNEPLLYLGNRLLKRTIDLILSLISILFILTWLPLLVKLAQIVFYPGPLFFVQKRIGQNGKVFNLYKFRTMFHSLDSTNAERGLSKKTTYFDNRIPLFGKLLRRTNLDEYPQFFNVLFGSMSAIGPRPHMVGEDELLEKHISRYRIRRFVKPGITGWAAINGFRGGTDDMDLMRKRTEYDIWYLENWSIWLDVKIVYRTIWQMLTLRIPKAY